MREGIYFTKEVDPFTQDKFNAANKVYMELFRLRNDNELKTQKSYDRICRARKEMSDLPSSLRQMAFASTDLFDLTLEQLDEHVSKKEFLAAAVLFKKIYWSLIWPDGFGSDNAREDAQKRTANFKIELITQTLASTDLTRTEELIRVLSGCDAPTDDLSINLVNKTIDTIEDRKRAFELASYWSTCPYFVSWNKEEPSGRIYSSLVGSSIVSLGRVRKLY